MRRLRVSLCLVFLALAAWLFWLLALPAPTFTRPARVTVAPGESAREVGARLARHGIVHSQTAFRLAVRLFCDWRRVKAGTYRLPPYSSAASIADLLASGHLERVRIVIPEGWTVELIAARLAAQGMGDGSPLGLADVPDYPPGLPQPPDGRLEGYLFPDTYFVEMAPEGRSALVGMMLDRLDQVVWRGLLGGREPAGLTFHQLLTLASLVEGEAKLDRERPLIAGVLTNRLRRGQRLECDATILYALGLRAQRVTHSDLAVDSPYNTYRYAGLPPGPINNPGLASIRAALHPAAVPYYYYVARADGSHVFSRTYQEHLAAVRRSRGQ